MKFKTTSKEVKNNYNNILKIPYCGAQYLLTFNESTAYNSGTYGWNYDLYDIKGVAICTGYRSMVGELVDWDLLKEYEKKAGTVLYGKSGEKKAEIQALLYEFIDKCIKG